MFFLDWFNNRGLSDSMKIHGVQQIVWQSISKWKNQLFLQDEVTRPRIYPSTQSRQMKYLGNSGFQNTGEEAVKECGLWEMGNKPAALALPQLAALVELPHSTGKGTWGWVQQVPWGDRSCESKEMKIAGVYRRVAENSELHRERTPENPSGSS